MKDSITIDGKIYISSRRAAEMSRYSNDYIGQLSRAGKVNARMMGRTWFVDQESLMSHKRSSEEAFQARCKNASREQKERAAYPGTPVSGSPSSAAAVLPMPSYPASNWAFTYSEDTRPLLPEIKKAFSMPASDGARGIHTTTHTSSFRASSTSAPFQRTVTGALLAVIIVVTVGFIFSTNRAGIAPIISQDQTARAGTAMDTVLIYIHGIYDRASDALAGLFSSQPHTVARNVQTPAQEPVAPTTLDWNGMAVVPSSDATDEETEQRIRNSFSDPVTVRANESGTAGVITPVFKKTNSDDFMYVLVPVKEEKK